MRECVVPGCTRSIDPKKNKFCDIHGLKGICRIEGCKKRVSRSSGYCYKHYTEYLPFKRFVSKQERFLNYVEKKEDKDCWEWTGARSGGYGSFFDGEGPIHAHVFAYFLHYGKLPRRVYLICKNRLCCNPNHMKAIF